MKMYSHVAVNTEYANKAAWIFLLFKHALRSFSCGETHISVHCACHDCLI